MMPNLADNYSTTVDVFFACVGAGNIFQFLFY